MEDKIKNICLIQSVFLSISRDTSIRPTVERVLKIWQERKVFEKDLVQKLLDQLNNGTVTCLFTVSPMN